MSDLLTGRPWAQAPWELVTCPDISAIAFRVAMAIQLHRRPDGRAPFPGQKRLAEMCTVSVPTVERAIKELKDAGVLVAKQRTRQGGQRSTNEYELRAPRQPSPVMDGPAITGEGAELDRSTGVPKQTGAMPPGETDGERAAGIWDALTETFGSAETETARSLRGKIVRSLLGAGATGDEVRAAPERYHARMPAGTTLTETALEKHWGLLQAEESTVTGGRNGRSSGRLSADRISQL